jgi:hypothetical protein
MTIPFMPGAMRIRVLTSMAVVGRDNEPMYLRGDLFDVDKFDVGISNKSNESDAVVVVTEDEGEGGRDGAAIDGPDKDDDDDDAKGVGELRSSSGSPSWGARGGGGGLFGRIKGVVGGVGGVGTRNNVDNNNQREHSRAGEVNGKIFDIGDSEDDDDDDDDPFGFFTNANGTNPISRRRKGGKRSSSSSSPPPSSSSNASSPNSTAVMSLTEQLVLHASLDKFEEMSCKSSAGGSGAGDRGPQQTGHVRWRGPGMNSPNSMYMGLLCRVEERWDVYGAFLALSGA